jgi:hypothetical protein
MDESTTIDWKSSGFDANLAREATPKSDYIGGANFDVQLDELMFNRMIRLRNLEQAPQGNDPGKIYYDNINKKYKMWVGGGAGWVDIQYTSTSTSTTSSSSSSTSTTTTSSSSSSSSTSTTSSSTSSSSTSTS